MRHLILLLAVFVLQSCYSFKGISIPPDVNSFYVEDFGNSAKNSPVDVNQIFAEALREKIRNESRLRYNEQNPDIEFQGTIKEYSVRSIPAQEDESALNRFEIKIQVQYVSNKNEDDSWDQLFSFYQDFESDVDLNSVQDELTETIFEQLTEDVFNKAFTNW